jgi:hypothetical protein
VTYESAISAVWPTVEAVGRAELRRFRLPADVVDDLLQDAAAVVMHKRPWFTSGDDLAPYVRVVVRRRALHWLRDRKREVVGGVPDRAATHGVAELAEHRLRLRGVAKAFEGLAPEERQRLVTYLGSEQRAGDVRARARERKQVERIRATMSRVAEGFAAALARLRLRFPWVEALPPQAAAAIMAVSLAVGTLVPGEPGYADTAELSVRGASGPAPAPAPVAPGAGGVQGAAPPMVDRTQGTSRVVDEPTTGPPTTEVVRIKAPTGDEGGVKTTPNGPDKNLVCAGGDVTPDVCVPQPPLPW